MRGRARASSISVHARADSTALLREALLAIDATALDLRVIATLIALHGDRAHDGPLELTLYQLGKLANGTPPDGTRRRMLRASLDRLSTPHPPTGALIANWEQRWAVTSGPVDFMEVARRRGDQLLITLGGWLADHAAAGVVCAGDVRAPEALHGYALKLWLLLANGTEPAHGPLRGTDVAASVGQPEAGGDWMRRVLSPAVQRLACADPDHRDLLLERRGDGSWWLTACAEQLAGGEDGADPDKGSRCAAVAVTDTCSTAEPDGWVVTSGT